MGASVTAAIRTWFVTGSSAGLGRALVTRPRLLLVDEASLGLAPIAVKSLMEQLRVIARERGTALIAVEQDASVALRLADRVYVIDRGETVWEGLSSQASAAGLARQYLGTAR